MEFGMDYISSPILLDPLLTLPKMQSSLMLQLASPLVVLPTPSILLRSHLLPQITGADILSLAPLLDRVSQTSSLTSMSIRVTVLDRSISGVLSSRSKIAQEFM